MGSWRTCDIHRNPTPLILAEQLGCGSSAGLILEIDQPQRKFPLGLITISGSEPPLGRFSSHCVSLSAYCLPRCLTHSTLSGCCGSGSTAHCSGVSVIRFAGRANGSAGYGRSACVRATGLLAAKVSIAAMRIPTAAATTLSNSAFAAMWMLCIAPTPARPTAKVTAPSGPTLAFSIAPVVRHSIRQSRCTRLSCV